MKRLLKIVVVLVLVVAIFVGVVFFYLDSGIKQTVETYGPHYTKSSVELANVNLSPLSGKVSLKGLVVGNPQGFQTKNAFSLGEITIALDTDTVAADPIVIESLRIIAPEITFEQGKSGSNLQQLQKNVAASTRSGANASGSAEQNAETGPGRKLIIRQLVISGGQIHYSNPLLGGKTVDVPLPDITLNGIGEKSNGATGAEVVEQLIKAINRNSLAAIKDSGALKQVGEQVEQRLQEGKGKLEESLEGFKGLLGK